MSCIHMYSRSLGEPRPRLCIHCGEPEVCLKCEDPESDNLHMCGKAQEIDCCGQDGCDCHENKITIGDTEPINEWMITAADGSTLAYQKPGGKPVFEDAEAAVLSLLNTLTCANCGKFKKLSAFCSEDCEQEVVNQT